MSRPAPAAAASNAAPPAAASPRERRRRQHRDLSRAQILDAAEEVFALKGFHDATIKEISTRAEFSVGAVYEFFENKDDLFAQLYARRGDEFMAGMRAVLHDAAPPRDRLHRLADFQIAFFREHAAFGRLFFRGPAGLKRPRNDRDLAPENSEDPEGPAFQPEKERESPIQRLFVIRLAGMDDSRPVVSTGR